MKRLLSNKWFGLIILLLAGLVLIAGVNIMYHYAPKQPSSGSSENITANWTLGQDISPLPNNIGKCSPSTLYSYYWLTSQGYDPDIMYGLHFDEGVLKAHVWLISDNVSYDWGKAWKGSTLRNYRGFFRVREVPLSKLVEWVAYDLRNT